MKMKLFSILILILFLFFCQTSAEAARNSTYIQTPASGTEFDMGTTQSLTYTITNANTGGNTGERIYEIRFRINTGSTFSSATTAPAGWTRTFYSTTSITFQANSWANCIVTGTSQSFTLVLTMRTPTADVSETLQDIRSRYTTTTTGPPFTRAGTDTINNPGLWTLRSLSITSFQTTDCAGSPISALTSGNNFCLVMTIRNISSATQSNIVSVANPPSAIKTGTVTQGLISTTYSPNPLTLATGASGTITFRYSTAGTDNGTIYFTAIARNNNGTGTARSRTATSNTLTVSRLTVGINIQGPVVASPTCVFSGDTVTFMMTVTNNTGSSVTNITPSVLTQCAYPPCAGTVAIGAFTGPVPACIGSIANGTSGTFTWTAPITGTINNPKSNFYVTGTVNYNKAACGAGGGTTSVVGTSNTEDLDGYIVTVAPSSTNASSTNQELTWTVTNEGCAATQSISIAYPAGWTYGGDAYSLINTTDESWTFSGSGSNPVIFTAPAPANQIPINADGDFSVVFTATPTTTGANTFNITITDANATPIAKTVSTSVTVNAFDSSTGGPNEAGTKTWRESY